MFKTKIHAGLMRDCKTCTPEQKPKYKRELKTKFMKSSGHQDVVTALKQQIREEVGDDELTLPQQFALLQKFGANAVQIERKMSKPAWIGEQEWKSRINQWIDMTTGCKIAGTQHRKPFHPKLPNKHLRYQNNPRHQSTSPRQG
jgi:hypothetical protein